MIRPLLATLRARKSRSIMLHYTGRDYVENLVENMFLKVLEFMFFRVHCSLGKARNVPKKR